MASGTRSIRALVAIALAACSSKSATEPTEPTEPLSNMAPATADHTPAPGSEVEREETDEAVNNIRKILDGARSYYLDAGKPIAGLDPIPAQFPGPGDGPVPEIGACCNSGGRCPPDAEHWINPLWTALAFSVDDPHYYSYAYSLSSDGSVVTATAYGDLDCDGDYSTFKMTATKVGERAMPELSELEVIDGNE